MYSARSQRRSYRCKLVEMLARERRAR